jgi:hypothetical protein
MPNKINNSVVKSSELPARPLFTCPGLTDYPALQTKNHLRLVFRHKNVYVLLPSRKMQTQLGEALKIIEDIAESFTLLPWSLEELPKIQAFFARISASPRQNILLLAEENYGPAFARLSAASSAYLPLLLPSGQLVPLMPGLIVQSGKIFADLSKTLGSLSQKRALVFNVGQQFRHLIKPKLEAYGCNAALDGLVDMDENRWGQELCGVKIFPPERLKEENYEVILADARTMSDVYAWMNKLAPELTPALFLVPHLGSIDVGCQVRLTSPIFLDSTTCKKNYRPVHFTKSIYRAIFKEHPAYSPEHYEEIREVATPLIFIA